MSEMLISLMPEILVASSSCLLLLLASFWQRKAYIINFYLSLITLFIVGIFCIKQYNLNLYSDLYNQYLIDRFSSFLKLALAFLSIISLVYCRYFHANFRVKSEYFVLIMLSILGMMLVISANNFLIIYLGLELTGLPLYTLNIVTYPNKKSVESAIKYFVLAALSTGLLLYGISLIYGVVKTFNLVDFVNYIVAYKELPTALWFGIAFVIAGIAFKFGAVPFHLWVPDLYQGGPLGASLIIVSLPKLAAFALAYRVLCSEVIHASSLAVNLTLGIALSSIVLGNLVAIGQNKLTRLLGYSAIGHIGFILLGILIGTDSGYKAALFYVLSYVLMTIGILGLLAAISTKDTLSQKLEYFAGLSKTHPVVAACLMLYLLSMLGLPPLPGFMAKWLVLSATLQAGYKLSAILAIVMSAIGAYYYLKVIKTLYFEPRNNSVVLPVVSKFFMLFIILHLGLTIVIGLMPNSLLAAISLSMQ